MGKGTKQSSSVTENAIAAACRGIKYVTLTLASCFRGVQKYFQCSWGYSNSNNDPTKTRIPILMCLDQKNQLF